MDFRFIAVALCCSLANLTVNAQLGQQSPIIPEGTGSNQCDNAVGEMTQPFSAITHISSVYFTYEGF
jgi:hypothetical protein